MGKRIRLFFLLLTILTSNFVVQAQQNKPRSTDKEALKKIAANQEKKYQASRDKALQQAKKNKWAISHTAPDGSTISLEGLADNGRPIYYITDNAVAAKTTNTSKVWGGGTSGLNLSGSLPALSGKLGVWDGGAVRATHQEYIGRIVNRDNSSSINSHATHVAGTMVARGLSSSAKGMAYGIPNLQAWSFSNDISEIAGAASDLLISNHSYGYLAGWRYINGAWYWMGDMNVSQTEDVYYGFYDQTAQIWDEVAYNAPYYLMVKAAGNSNNATEPAVGTPYYRFNPSLGSYELVAARSAQMRTYSGYDVIPDHSVAKNILTVGAIHGLSNGYNQPSDVVSASFSSWGPTDDGRIKPDLVGDGVNVVSTSSGSDDNYAAGSGTSMAAPSVSGALVLLQDHYARLKNGNFMRAATLKGLAIHTTQEAGAAAGPDYVFGWGVLNIDQGVKVISNSNKSHIIQEYTLNQGATYTQEIIAAGTEPLRATISWTDPAGAVLPLIPSTLNNRTPRLVNDLDIRITKNGTTYLPWVLDPASPATAATTGDNIRDNVEQIVINNPTPGATYTITITHKGSLTNTDQDYSLIVSGLQPIQYCNSESESALNSHVGNLLMGVLSNFNLSGCSTHSDFTSMVKNVEAGEVFPIEVTLGSCGDQAPKIVKIFADWNEDGDFDDSAETAAISSILTNEPKFSTSIQVPTTVIIGNSTRLRIIVQETSDPTLVLPCGTYAKGETEDYTLKFIASSKDLGVTAISLPGNTNFYKNASQFVQVKLKNFGSASQTNIPVTISVTANGNQVATLTGTFTGTLAAYEEINYLVPQTFSSLAATNYQFTASTSLANDQNITNNQVTTNLATAAASVVPVITATSCEGSPTVALKGTGTGTIFWYTAATGGDFLGFGTNLNTTYKPANRKYFAAVNDYAATIGTLKNNTIGTFASDTASIFFNASLPFILDKVTINVQTAGTLNVFLIGPDKSTVASKQIQVSPGISEYALNLTIPNSGNKYRLKITAFAGATINRNNGTGTVVYPYSDSPVFSITGNTRSGTYFYLYNWQVRAAGSPSNRVAVKANGTLSATNLAVCAGTNSGSFTLNNFPGSIVRWENSVNGTNWLPINQTANSYSFTNLVSTTHYRAIISDGGCTEAISDTLTVTVNPLPMATISNSGSNIICPTDNIILTASAGVSYLWSTGATTASINVSAAGNYTVRVTDANGCSATSAPLTIINNQTAWTGAVDTNWFNILNWSCQVPDANSDVTIPVVSADKFYPVISSGTVTCHNLTILGTVTVSGGFLDIKGNFINNGVFNQSAGTLELIGTTNQEISGGNYLNLTINNAAVTTVTSDIAVAGTLNLASGSVNTGNNKITLGADAVLTETNTNYIAGKVEATRTFTNVQDTHNFGNMGLQVTTPTAPGEIKVTRVTDANNLNPLKHIKRYYEIHVVSGANTNLNASITFNYLEHELNLQSKGGLILFRSPDNGLTWQRKDSTVENIADGVYSLTLSGIKSFSTWTAGNRTEITPLPVTILSFNAQKIKNNVSLNWVTATEKNNKGFEVEVSTDAAKYRRLGFVAAKSANSQLRQNYQFTDTENGKSGVRYYRLKQLDLDGKQEYFGPKAINFEDAKPGLTLYPNPTNGKFQLLINAITDEEMLLEISDLAGKQVYSLTKALRKGNNEFQIILPVQLPKGLYQLTTRSANLQEHRKLVLE